MATRYVVTAPLVTVKTMTSNGPAWINIGQGGMVPADADETWAERHVADGLITPVAAEPAPAPPPVPAPEPAREEAPASRRSTAHVAAKGDQGR